ncbi:glycolate oxidase subunit GlcE [Halomonas binhaiensis]|uniref:Glycolate oxidase subunit GlcE n=1 Tax=Halomonas binhaiensis TaxID=2562282 RepID=A0A5C1NL63_9GAMM|nr:glycolate oxidase subunit GlcE [Halomonas binhaiensis]QEM82855.1 glycolate oxidase subunit GlcE [Halomonas binhaiensis]
MSDQRFPTQDALDSLRAQVRQASENESPLRIEGGNTKAFYGRPVAGETISTIEHRGITHYDPVELIVSVRAGTPLAELEAALASEGQMLAFEPPHYGPGATIGGTIATGLSGPRRPWSGAVRDFVLGVRLLNHQGQEHRFGGEVMKNVAGYDLSRLMVGAQGTLGLITEVSLKVLPKPGACHSLRLDISLTEALSQLAKWGQKPLPLSAATWHDGALHLRLEGGPSSVADTCRMIGGDSLDNAYWEDLREQQLPFFQQNDMPLWRLSLPANTAPLEIPGIDAESLIHDWAGCQRWLHADVNTGTLRSICAQAGGHATCFTPDKLPESAGPFTPLEPMVAKYHDRLKEQLDPQGIFNRGRLYAEF